MKNSDEQILAHLDDVNRGRTVYKERAGEVYGVCRRRGGVLDIKFGITTNTSVCQADYRDKCAPVEFLWLVKYRCSQPKRIGRCFASLIFLYQPN